MSEEERELIEKNIVLEFSSPNKLSEEDELAEKISKDIKEDIDKMCFNYRLLGEIHNKDVEIREDLRKRIDKAIEYIDNTYNDMSYDNNGHHYYKNGADLLDILRGEDKE